MTGDVIKPLGAHVHQSNQAGDDTRLARDPTLAAEFRRTVETDGACAHDPLARRRPSWNERLNLHPVLRADVAPQHGGCRHPRWR